MTIAPHQINSRLEFIYHNIWHVSDHIIHININNRKIIELEEELKIVGNNMKSLEIAEQEVSRIHHVAAHTPSIKNIFI